MALRLLQILVLSLLALQQVSAWGKVICYYESWAEYTFAPEDIGVSICTHINYAFFGINSDGSLRMDGGDDIIWRLSNLKQRNPNLKLLFSVGGWSEGSTGFSNVASNAGRKSRMAEHALELMNTYNFDGIDIDWEYPGERGGTPADQENFIDMLWVIRNAFNAAGGEKLITVAVSSSPWGGGYNVAAISKVVDSINVMTYDFHGAYDGVTGENSPLYGGNDGANCDNSVNNWINQGASPDKVVLGLAFYGHTYQLSDPNNHGIGAPVWGQGIEGGYLGYSQICTMGWTEEWSDEQRVPYAYSGDQWVGFDNVRSIGEKVQYAKGKNLGGVMMWAIDNDDKDGACGVINPLLNAIRNNL